MRSNVPRPQAVLRGHAGEVQALDFDAAERVLVSGDSLGEVRVWDLRDLRPAAMRHLHPLTGGILSLRLFRSAGRQLLGTQGRDGSTHLWAWDDQGELPEEPVRSFVSDCYSFCRFSVLAPEQPPGSEQGAHQVGSSSEAQQQEQEQRQADEFVAAVLAGDDADPEDGSSAPGDAATQAADAAAAGTASEGGAGSHSATKGSAGGDSAAPACTAAAAIWGLHPCPRANAKQPPALLALPGGDERTAALVCCACGASLAAFREEAAGRKLGMLMAVQLYYLPPAPAAAAGSAAGAAGGVCGSAEDAVVVFKLDHSARPPKIGVRHQIELRKEGIGDAVVRPDGKLLVTGSWDGRVRVYKYRSGRALAILKYHTSPVTGLCFAPRSMLLATAARDGTLALWPLYQPDEQG
ncbi:DECREASED SIZE EXCLUSION LIMIT 1 [Chlorella sorokiniana]|uniref:DECREASED SIZE EXCLUSION LIMIT 1 n=1 Tax=Chlorella sorokiniana TaxID=3076 RepID=A0A2P6TLC2_CHLSO|nr:DECREASED SIZE EXCLUSION LIMIT 1 [Chlorella sorokiniana]|eukprot:PRW45092.1 DECREASED SIZE EXCLUSION LIMIT 1 [Chlorella sorokiniana]